MTRRGRPRKPTQWKRIAGTLQPCRTNPDEPIPDGPLFGPPDGLTDAEREHWVRLETVAPWLTCADRDAVRQCVETWSDYRAERAKLEARGSVDDGPAEPRQSACCRNVMKLHCELHALSRALGLQQQFNLRGRLP